MDHLDKNKNKKALLYLVHKFINAYISKNNNQDSSSIDESSSEDSALEYNYSEDEENASFLGFLFNTKKKKETYLDNNNNFSDLKNNIELFEYKDSEYTESDLSKNKELGNIFLKNSTSSSSENNSTVINTEHLKNFIQTDYNSKEKSINPSDNFQNKLIEDLQDSINNLNKKVDKLMNTNKKLIEFTEVIKNDSNESDFLDTIHMWNKIERKNKNTSKKLITNQHKSNSQYDSVFIAQASESTSEAYYNSSDSSKSDVIDRYVVKNNSEEDDGVQDNIMEFYFPKYNQLKNN